MKTKGKHKTSNFLNTYTSDHVILMPKHLPEPLIFCNKVKISRHGIPDPVNPQYTPVLLDLSLYCSLLSENPKAVLLLCFAEID